jgi:elongation factor G
MAAKVFESTNIRNIALVGHGGCGKTSLAEAMLFLSGTSSRHGKVDDKTSTLDYEPEEHTRGGSIATSLAWMVHNNKKINLLDTPGDQNFIYDALNSMRGADAVVVVVSAPDGIEVQTQRVFEAAGDLGLPRAIFINKMDRERADAESCLREIKSVLGVTPVPLQVPIGKEGNFRGVVSLLQKKAFVYGSDGSGKYEKTDVPSELADVVENATEQLIENVAETDEDLLEQYLETFELTGDQVQAGLQKALGSGELVPVFFGAATQCIGANSLLELITWAFPSPIDRATVSGQKGDAAFEFECSASGDFLAQVIHTKVDEFSGKMSIFRIFRGTVPADPVVENVTRGINERLGSVFTVRGKERESVSNAVAGDILGVAKLKDTRTGDTLGALRSLGTIDTVHYPPPMMAYVIRPASKGDADKIKVGLDRILEEDPTLTVATEDLTQQLVLQGMGQAHLDMAIARLKRKFKVSVTTDLPPVPYRETLKKAVQHIEGKHKKQTGGAGQYGVAFMNVAPLSRNEGFAFVDLIKGGSIPRQFIPAVEKGVHACMKNGFLAGYPIVDIKVELVDGKHHPVDSKDVAFQMAGSKGLRAAFAKGGSVLLEPIMEMEIVVPTEVMGDVLGDMNGRRGRVLGMDPAGKNTVIKTQCPMAEVQSYAPQLKGMTGGKGSFTMSLFGYENLPQHLVNKVVAASPFKKDDEE